MLYGNYRFRMRFEAAAELPAYKGSTFRGAFGHALKRVVCALKRQECPECILRERCLYTRVFETSLSGASDKTVRNSAPPHPFVIQAPPGTQTSYAPGDELECGLLLFGEVNRLLPYFIYTFEEMGRIGIGRRGTGNAPGTFRLLEVASRGRTLYAAEDGRLLPEEVTEELTLSAGSTLDAPQSLRVKLETPLRFKQEGRLSDGLSFETLVRLALRRASSLMQAFGEGEPDLDYRGLVARAGAVSASPCAIRWTDWERYSNRQKQRMQLGGLTGSVVYRGALSEFRPLLEFAAKTHIGKQTSFGLGRIAVRYGS